MDLTQVVQNAFEVYRTFNELHPLLGSMATAELIYPISDIVSQKITDGAIDWKKVRYTAVLSPAYGAGIFGCIESQHVVPDGIESAMIGKAALSNLFGGLIFNSFFFMNNTIGERNDYDLGKLVSHYTSFFRPTTKSTTEGNMYSKMRDTYQAVKEKIKSSIPYQEFTKAFLGSITLWTAFQYANFSYNPPELQTPTSLSMAFIWTVFLSAWSLTGRRRLAQNTTTP